MDRKKRIALYGGTFDPVHLGHLEVARNVTQLFEIDEFLFIPAQVAPHKLGQAVTPALQRYAMLTLATQEEGNLRISTFEIDAPGLRYTVDTLAHFRAELADSADLFFVMGADSWKEITTWHEWEHVLTMANHIVVTRPGYDVTTELIGSSFADRVVDLREVGQDGRLRVLRAARGEKIFVTDVVMVDFSATEIRRAARLFRFADLVKLVPAPVANYIGKYGLYRDSNET